GPTLRSEIRHANARHATHRLRAGTQGGTLLDLRRAAGEAGKSRRAKNCVTLKRLPIVLASIHLALFLIALLSGDRFGNAFFCVDFPISLPLVLTYKTSTLVVVGLLGTGWWYFIGQIGRSSKVG